MNSNIQDYKDKKALIETLISSAESNINRIESVMKGLSGDNGPKYYCLNRLREYRIELGELQSSLVAAEAHIKILTPPPPPLVPILKPISKVIPRDTAIALTEIRFE